MRSEEGGDSGEDTSSSVHRPSDGHHPGDLEGMVDELEQRVVAERRSAAAQGNAGRGLVPDLCTQDGRVQALGGPPGRALGVGERLGERVHLIDGGETQQQGPPRQRQPRPVLSCTVHVDGGVLLTGQQGVPLRIVS